MVQNNSPCMYLAHHPGTVAYTNALDKPPWKDKALSSEFAVDHKPKGDHSWSNWSIIMVLEHCVDMQGACCWWGPGCNEWCCLGWCLKLRLSLLPSLHPQQHPSHHSCLHHPPLCQRVSGWPPGTYPCAPHGPAPPGYALYCWLAFSFLSHLFHPDGLLVYFPFACIHDSLLLSQDLQR